MAKGLRSKSKRKIRAIRRIEKTPIVSRKVKMFQEIVQILSLLNSNSFSMAI